MELGDAVEKVTSAVGIEPCKGCKQRKEILNTISRRGLIGGSVAALFLAKNAVLKAAWKTAGAEMPLYLGAVLGFVRTANTAQYTGFAPEGTPPHEGVQHRTKFLPREEMLAAIASRREFFDPKHSAYVWMSKFSPAASEVLPGWTLDFDVDDSPSYRLILRGNDYTFITDEKGGIYRAITRNGTPSAKSLRAASDFPSAVGIGALTEKDDVPVSLWERLKAFLTPVAYAAMGCCASSIKCYLCGCGTCILDCCQWAYCDVTNCSGSNCCMMNVGCTGGPIDCPWFNAPCDSGTCNCCGQLLHTGCAKQCLCGSCPPCY